MATSKPFSMSAWVKYGNACLNNADGKTPEMQNAFRTDLKKAIAKAGYPSKDEIGIVDTINDFDMSATLECTGQMVSGFINDTERAFNLPAPNANATPASIKIKHKDEVVKTGITQMGENKGSTYTSTIAAHDEFAVKNNKKSFKK